MFRAMLKMLMGKESKMDHMSLSDYGDQCRLISRDWWGKCVSESACVCMLMCTSVYWIYLRCLEFASQLCSLLWVFLLFMTPGSLKLPIKRDFPFLKHVQFGHFHLNVLLLNVFLSSKVVTPVFRNNLLLSVFSLYIICQYVLPGNWTHNLLRC